MKLATKLVAVVLIEIVLLLGVDAYIATQHETSQTSDEMKRDAHLLGSALKECLLQTWRTQGQSEALSLLRRANVDQADVRVRWVWVDGSDNQYSPAASLEQLQPVRSGKEQSLELVTVGGGRRLYTYIPVNVEDGRAGAIELSESMGHLTTQAHNTLLKNMLLAGLLVAAGGVSVMVVGFFLIGRPLHRLAEKAHRVGQGDLTGTVTLCGNDELAELGRSMNKMCDQLAAAQARARHEQQRRLVALEQLRQADRLKTVGHLAAGVAHELGTPLNTVSARAEMIESGNLSSEQIEQNARIVRSQSARMARIIRQLLDYARQRPVERQPIDLAKLVDDAAELLTPLSNKADITLTVNQIDNDLIALVDASQIQQVLINLLSNALAAVEEGGHVEVELGRRQVSPSIPGQPSPVECFYVAIKDDGIGISSETIKHVFDPFFTTKDVGQGTGLGLSIAYGMVQEHSGWIDVKSERGQGSCFMVFLPCHANRAPQAVLNGSKDLCESLADHGVQTVPGKP